MSREGTPATDRPVAADDAVDRKTKERHVLHTHGWEPDPPDDRDYTLDHPKHRAAAPPWRAPRDKVPAQVDLREWMPPIVNQGNLPICTAAVATGLMGYYARRAHGEDEPLSLMFNYRASRALSGNPDRQASFLRYAMAAWALCGTIPEKFWPFDETKLDQDAPAFCFSVAQNYKSVSYHRVDAGLEPEDLLMELKRCLSRGLPVTLGFSLHPSLIQSFETSTIPTPAPDEQSLGGHAVLLAGFDVERECLSGDKTTTTKGAFLIRNSWGEVWGEKGYGWLPFEWVLQGLTKDCWVVTRETWIDSGEFER